MAIYKLVSVIERTLIDTFNLEVEAGDAEEAQDVAYEVMSSYPYSDIPLNKLLRVKSEAERPFSIAIEFQREELEQEQEAAEEVFSDGDEDPDPEPPRRA